MLKLAGFSFSATMEFAKPPLSYADQAALLIERGLVVSDPNVLMRQLEAVGYYRLCAYWHPFKQADSSFAPGTSFDVVWNRRNICAHHARLWNRELAIRPTVPDVKNGPEWHRPQSIDTDRMFVVLTILRFLLHRVAPQSAWRDRLFARCPSGSPHTTRKRAETTTAGPRERADGSRSIRRPGIRQK